MDENQTQGDTIMKKTAFLLLTLATFLPLEANNMKASPKCVEHIKKYEKCSLTAYKDGNGYTIGWGHHTPQVTPNMTITQKQADKWLAEDIAEAEKYANHLIKSLPYNYNFSQGFFDGLVSLIYNCGCGNIKNSKFFNTLKKCRVTKGTMNRTDYAFTISLVRNTCTTANGHRKRRADEARMMNTL